MQIAILLFDDITALDAVGPYEVLASLPDAEIRMVARHPGPKRAAGGLGLVADHALSAVPDPDIIVIPGGDGVQAVMNDEDVLEWLRAAHATSRYTTSICTGALILGAAGLLQGLKATTHWRHRDRLRQFGARPVDRRYVVEGKIITAAGISAGIDMALHLVRLIADDTMAQKVQLRLEYDPHPPFNAGSPATAPQEVIDLFED